MAVIDEFSARDLADALRAIAGVLADHAEAIDSLDASAGPIDPSSIDPSDGPDRPSTPFGSSPDVDMTSVTAPDRVGPRGAGSDAAATLTAAIDAAGPVKDLLTLTSRMSGAAQKTATGPGGRVIGQLLGALADISSSADSIDAERFALALEMAAELAAGATVGAPRGEYPGTHGGTDRGSGGTGGVVAVLAAASVGALRALDQDMSLVEVVIAAADEGLDELESGVATNERLAHAGVVDAAGAVFLLVLDSLAAIATGDPLPEPPVEEVVHVGDGVTMFRVGCVALPVGTDMPGPPGGVGDRSSGQWLETCDWIETTLSELGAITKFSVGSAGCELEVVTADAGRVVESLCSVARPSELSISLDHGRVAEDVPRVTSSGHDPSL